LKPKPKPTAENKPKQVRSKKSKERRLSRWGDNKSGKAGGPLWVEVKNMDEKLAIIKRKMWL